MSRAKGEIRKEVLLRRDSLSQETRGLKDARIRTTLISLPEFREAGTVLLYASFRREADTLCIISHCLSIGKKVILPRVDRENTALILYEVRAMYELSRGYMGIPEPLLPEERRRDVTDSDLIVVPGVAFDRNCNRLGYGKGFYDRLLQDKGDRKVVALAYTDQILDALPAEPHDVQMDLVVTDEEVIVRPDRDMDLCS
ncbi:MAG: 5-formyltetrahydrofolate cyclo-ligase [Nitrospirales bacterium]|nr:5-formyltetrahydrofolate cyclo-ligase [Nitrospirales bacterium]